MRILYVCTANICRSASAQRLLLDALVAAPELSGIEVRSAGTQARPGSPGCSMAPALVGHAAEHRSQALTADLVAWADLILPAARDHRPSILALEPTSRSRTFTIRQVGRIADWMVGSGIVAAGRERSVWGADPGEWADGFPVGDPRRDVQALPHDPDERWVWVVSEVDAARGLTGAPLLPSELSDDAVPAEPPRRRWPGRRRGSVVGRRGMAQPGGTGQTAVAGDAIDPSELHPDDVPDPHYLGAGLHPLAYEQIQGSTDALVRLLREVAAAG